MTKLGLQYFNLISKLKTQYEVHLQFINLMRFLMILTIFTSASYLRKIIAVLNKMTTHLTIPKTIRKHRELTWKIVRQKLLYN